MERLNFSILINAPKEKVWNTMLDDEIYRIWTEPFAKGSHYKGEWKKGSKLLFLAPDENGDMGMVSRVKELTEYEFVSLEHIGVVNHGVEDTSSETAKGWAGALENYTFKESDSKTELLIESDILEEYKEMFESIWPKALNTLKELAEN
jgi:uncharacterized protein YndB with AHSA1/START domain